MRWLGAAWAESVPLLFGLRSIFFMFERCKPRRNGRPKQFFFGDEFSITCTAYISCGGGGGLVHLWQKESKMYRND